MPRSKGFACTSFPTYPKFARLTAACSFLYQLDALGGPKATLDAAFPVLNLGERVGSAKLQKEHALVHTDKL